jgi:hypothetical protein
MAPVPLTMGAPDADSQGATYSSWMIIATISPPPGKVIASEILLKGKQGVEPADYPPLEISECLVLNFSLAIP